MLFQLQVLIYLLGYNSTPAAGTPAESSIGIKYNDLMDGLTVVAGRMDDSDTAENDTYGFTYTMGSMTAGYQITKVDYEAAGTADQDATHYGISVAVNENLSVSAGRQEAEIDNAAEDEVNAGFVCILYYGFNHYWWWFEQC